MHTFIRESCNGAVVMTSETRTLCISGEKTGKRTNETTRSPAGGNVAF